MNLNFINIYICLNVMNKSNINNTNIYPDKIK